MPILSTSSLLIRAALLIVLPCVFLSGCDRSARVGVAEAPAADTVALLDGQALSRALLDEVARQQVGTPDPYDAPAAAAAVAAAAAPVDPEQHQRLVDELVEIELLARKARERGIDKRPELQAEAALLEKTLLSQAMVREQVAALHVSDTELAGAYEERVPPHLFRIAHIQLADEAAAHNVLKELQSGRPFAELAKRHSQDADNRNQGGVIGSMMFDQMPAEIATAVRHLKPGDVAPQPVHTKQGWHVVRLQALEPLAERPTLQAARVWLHPQIVQTKVQAEQQQWRREAEVQLTRSADRALPTDVVAVVNGQPVSRSLLDELVRARGANGAPVSAPERSQVLDDLVSTELMSQRATSTGVANKPQTRAELELAYKALLGQHLLRQLVADVPVDDASLQVRYRDLPPDTQIDVSHVLVKEEGEARALIGQLERGASFGNLARKHSLDTESRVKGGALGVVPVSELEAPFAKAAMALKPGQYTREPVHTEHGWHVIRLTSQRSTPKRSFEALKPALRAQLATERLQAQMNQWKKEAKVTVMKAP